MNVNRITRRHIPEYNTVQNRRREIVKSPQPTEIFKLAECIRRPRDWTILIRGGSVGKAKDYGLDGGGVSI
jgi:hypothetical protein